VGLKLAQYAVGLAALAWALGRVEWGRAAALLGEVSPGVITALVAVSGLGLLGRFLMWHALLGHVRPTRFRTAASATLVVSFVNLLLPSRFSGRAAAPFILRTEANVAYPEAVAIAGVHTGLYALVYGLVALTGLALAVGTLPAGRGRALARSTDRDFLAGALGWRAGFNLGVVERAAALLEGVLRRMPAVGERLAGLAGALPTFTADSADAFRELSSAPGVLAAYAAGWCGALLLAPGLRVWLLFDALGTGFEPALFLPLYLVAAYSVTLLPLTPGGIGVTEATATAVFVALGVPAAVVVPVVFVDRFLGVYLPALAGWYPSLRIDLSGLAAE
jgi:uncharacterized protein (TIRG00374 family)